MGLFLEITPSWTQSAGVVYQKSPAWHFAGSVFLTGYSIEDRKKLIDIAFEQFKTIFGDYPKSVGAWFIDAHSLEYMQDKYQIDSALIVADQYSTDNYQIWGQFWEAPYYPQRRNTLVPAQTKEDKLPVVVTQWAARDPVNGYGKAVEESTYSVQANDYLDYHNLDTGYFTKLVDIYTNQKYNKFNQLVVGLENSYSWNKYQPEYLNQIQVLAQKQKSGQLIVVTLGTFAKWYKANFPDISPEQVIIADDPLGSSSKAVWYMNPYYRVAWFYNSSGVVIKDIRQYLESKEQLCYDRSCQSLNFATSATRVLDDVSFHRSWLIDEGRVSDLKFAKENQSFLIDYVNDAQKKRVLEFMPRDISLDGVISSIDGAILNATIAFIDQSKITPNLDTTLKRSLISFGFESFKFILFVLLVFLIPGMVLLNFKRDNLTLEKIFISLILGIVSFTLISYLFKLANLNLLIFAYLALINIYFILSRKYQDLIKLKISLKNWTLYLVILVGVIFQIIPVFRSGLQFGYGLGFWGPNAHDGVWHIALINQIDKNLPPVNPIYSGVILKNYHYLYDLLVSISSEITKILPIDLVFRFFPILFSLLLGIGTVVLFKKIFKNYITEKLLNTAVVFSLIFVYFTGSFGWIVTYLHEHLLSGESAFWANQSISFNLNPPYALSLAIVIACLILFKEIKENLKIPILLGLLLGSLIGFKAYGAIILFLSFFVVLLLNLRSKVSLKLLMLLILGFLISLGIYLPNFTYSSTFLLQPFWLVNSMIDFPDRVGWLKLSSARSAYFERKEWFKFILVESLSLVLFIIGNLGVRFLGIFLIFKIGKVKSDLLLQLILVALFFSLFIPLLFVQTGTAWNTIQFLYYFIYLIALPAGLVVAFLIYKLPKALSFLVILVLIILAPINSIATAKGYLYKYPHAYISNLELQALDFLKNQPDAVVLTFPFNKDDREKFQSVYPLFAYDTTAYVSAISKKQVFLEDEIQNDILSLSNTKKRVESKTFFASLGRENKDFLKRNNIEYIYLQKYYKINLDEISSVQKIFENKEVLIYEVK